MACLFINRNMTFITGLHDSVIGLWICEVLDRAGRIGGRDVDM